MRFISRHPGYTFGLQLEYVEYLQDGQGRTVQNVKTPMIDLQFSNRVSLFPWEVEVGMSHFKFDGGLLEEDGITKITPLYQLSVLDTNQIANFHKMNQQQKEKMEEKLLNDQFYGADFIMVEEPRVSAPWPTYDDAPTVAKLLEQIVALGFSKTNEDLDRIFNYERQNAGRDEVFSAIEKLKAEIPEEVLVSA